MTPDPSHGDLSWWHGIMAAVAGIGGWFGRVAHGKIRERSNGGDDDKHLRALESIERAIREGNTASQEMTRSEGRETRKLLHANHEALSGRLGKLEAGHAILLDRERRRDL